MLDFLKEKQHPLDLVRFVLYTREDANAFNIFAKTLQELLAETEK